MILDFLLTFLITLFDLTMQYKMKLSIKYFKNVFLYMITEKSIIGKT